MRIMNLGIVTAVAMLLTIGPGCSREEAPAPAADAGAPRDAVAVEETVAAAAVPDAGANVPGTATNDANVEVLDEASLREDARVEIHQYQAAFIGSGTLGKGTLYAGTAAYPFRIGGLGIGGIGVAKVDATGHAYNLDDPEHLAGTYGNARLGATAADKGGGRLWLKNQHGVVLKLETDMQGLALTGGVDGVVISWESDVQESLRNARDGSKKAWDKTKGGTKRAWKSVRDAVD